MDKKDIINILTDTAMFMESIVNAKHRTTQKGNGNKYKVAVADGPGLTSVTPNMLSGVAFSLNAPANVSFVEKDATQHLLRYAINPENLDNFTYDDAVAICASMAARLEEIIGEAANKPTVGRTRGSFVIPGTRDRVLERPDGSLEIRLWADFVVA